MSGETASDWQPPSLEMFEFQQLLRNSKNIIAVCGAGLSAASGEGWITALKY
jgi:hypothetical protein